MYGCARVRYNGLFSRGGLDISGDINCYHDGVNFYVTGRSTVDGSEINLVISIFGDEEAEVIFGGDEK